MAGSATVARQLAQDILVRVARDAAFAERVLHTALERVPLEARDRAMVTELVYGTLRHSAFLDAQLMVHARKPLSSLPQPVLAALRLGAYQLLCMRVPAHSAVHESVALVRRYGKMSGLVNALLRQVARTPRSTETPQTPEELACQGSHPLWLVEHVVALRGWEAAVAWVNANNAPAPISLRANRLQITREILQQLLKDAGIDTEIPAGSPPDSLVIRRAGAVKKLPGFSEGQFFVQDFAASWVGHLAAPQAGHVVIDLCSAPGGKATHAAELMDDRGLVLAVDVHPAKIRLIDENAQRLGLSSVKTVALDGRDTQALRGALQTHGHELADSVVLDAPCSGLGTLRRNPELRHKQPADVDALAALQAELLDGVAPLVRPGGTLVYSVCTITAAEGPEQVAKFVTRHPEFTIEPLGPEFAAMADGPFLRTWTDLHCCDSFFAARLRRTKQ